MNFYNPLFQNQLGEKLNNKSLGVATGFLNFSSVVLILNKFVVNFRRSTLYEFIKENSPFSLTSLHHLISLGEYLDIDESPELIRESFKVIERVDSWDVKGFLRIFTQRFHSDILTLELVGVSHGVCIKEWWGCSHKIILLGISWRGPFRGLLRERESTYTRVFLLLSFLSNLVNFVRKHQVFNWGLIIWKLQQSIECFLLLLQWRFSCSLFGKMTWLYWKLR